MRTPDKKAEQRHLTRKISETERDESANLGLDADQSSSGDEFLNNLNSDNDRISGNPDGEDDKNDTSESPGNSPLEDK
ncbi:hypothetical protein [Pedobacter antarcticus]|uniref:hypothetical protein n=1 Tax=Pedobacter antarcticus TaxID=34086 RepID=UPI002931439A|nr:hypothetical protein [Pedobacter antarcticus]